MSVTKVVQEVDATGVETGTSETQTVTQVTSEKVLEPTNHMQMLDDVCAKILQFLHQNG